MSVHTAPVVGGFPKNFARRVIGPIPPRDKQGKLMIAPHLAKRVKLNALGEPVRDDKGQPIEEMADTRQPWEYKLYEPGMENYIAEGATKGLKLFLVDYGIEPLAKVYAHNAEEAVRVYKAEWGITRCAETDPKATEIAA